MNTKKIEKTRKKRMRYFKENVIPFFFLIRWRCGQDRLKNNWDSYDSARMLYA